MTDTIGYDEAYAINNKITNSLIDGLVHQYAWYKSRDEYGQATVVQVNNICCLGYEDIYGNKYDMMDGVDLPNDSGNQGQMAHLDAGRHGAVGTGQNVQRPMDNRRGAWQVYGHGSGR